MTEPDLTGYEIGDRVLAVLDPDTTHDQAERLGQALGAAGLHALVVIGDSTFTLITEDLPSQLFNMGRRVLDPAESFDLEDRSQIAVLLTAAALELTDPNPQETTHAD
jgi:hypothetical protein